MFKEVSTPAKKYAKGMGKAVADRTINRKTFREFKKKTWIKTMIQGNSVEDAVNEWAKTNEYEVERFTVISEIADNLRQVKILVTGKYEVEEWEDVAYRVAVGNALLAPTSEQVFEFEKLNHHLRQASILLSGRHLQHGDEEQPNRNQEVFTNCSTAAASFITFYLLLNGSGVGRCYDDDMMIINWDNMPIVVNVIDQTHGDVASGEIVAIDRRNAEHLYAGKTVHVFEVPDSREGWAKAVEKIEAMAYAGTYREDVLLLDFSQVRPKGSPIRGMQNRPASGPGPLMAAIANLARVRGAGMPRWRQAMYIDHYLAECVLVGGARRAARMSTKDWQDAGVLDFISVKRGGFLWSSNNSVTVDRDFWELVRGEGTDTLSLHAKKVFEAITLAAYEDGTGEPGFINQDRLVHNNTGLNSYVGTGRFIGSKKYEIEPETATLTRVLAANMLGKRYNMITNPCGEIALNVIGGYCVIGDVVPYHSQNDNDLEDAVRTTVRALIRTNTMDCLYRPEVDRTNRIGVGLTGIHEYAWKRFGLGWKDIVDENRSIDFWMMLSRLKRAVVNESEVYSRRLGVGIPHTNTTVKPSGTISKLFGLTEGAHLPTMREYLRWVQLRNDDPLVVQYASLGYPVKKLVVYSGTTIVGFPTRPEICKLGMGDALVTAAEATPLEQYQYLRLLEKYWIKGVDEEGNPLPQDTGNQVSYTLKYDPKKVSYQDFRQVVLEQQPTVRCCSVMPQTDVEGYAYEYLPEHPVTKHEYEQIMNAILDDDIKEDVGLEHVDCSSGACPVSFGENSAST